MRHLLVLVLIIAIPQTYLLWAQKERAFSNPSLLDCDQENSERSESNQDWVQFRMMGLFDGTLLGFMRRLVLQSLLPI
ncbi:MAG: hypothetical protein D6723_18795 [Acidobacteria bacterium]|nr:MAG: hypothetical protein D6723_18795 [Acidobacteriota bacterium]